MEDNTYQKEAEEFLINTGTRYEAKFERFGSMDWDERGQRRNIFKVTFSNERGEMSVTFGDSVADSCAKVAKLELDGPVEENLGMAFRYGGESFMWSVKTDTKTLRAIDAGEVKPESIIDVDALTTAWEAWKLNFAAIQKKKKWVNDKFNTPPKTVEDMSIKLVNNIRNKITELKKQKDYGNVQVADIKKLHAYEVLAALTKSDPGTFENFCSEYGYDEDSRKAERTWKAVTEEWKDVSTLWTEEEIVKLQEIQ